MAKILKALYRVVCDTALVFTGVMLLFGVFFLSDSAGGRGLHKDVMLSFFYFALIIGIASLFFLLKRLPAVATAVMHFVLSSVGFAWKILGVAGESSVKTVTQMTSAGMFIATVLFVIIYWGIFAIAKFIQIPMKKGDKAEEPDIKVVEE